jgi:Bacterial regulatory proteins, luxR family
MAAGYTADQIAEQLGMSVYTLRTHTQNILTKLGVHSRLEALVLAIRFGKVTTLNLSEDEEPQGEEPQGEEAEDEESEA